MRERAPVQRTQTAASVAGRFRASRFHGCFLCAILASATATRAGAQILTSNGLQCGNMTVPLEVEHGTTLGANGARKERIQNLYTVAAEAYSVCGSVSLPGCDALVAWTRRLEKLYVLRHPTPDLLKRADEMRIAAEAARVLAHRACRTGTYRLYFDQACVDLVKAEQAAGHFATNTRSEGADSTSDDRAALIGKLKTVGSASNVPKIARLLVQLTSDKTANVEYQKLQKQAADCRLQGDKCPPDKMYLMAALDGVDDLLMLQRFYADGYDSTVEAATPLIDLRVDAVTYGKPPTKDFSDRQTVPGDGLRDYFMALYDEAKSSSGSCKTAAFYISPSGALVHNEDRRDSVCVDTSLYSIDRPFEVEVTQYPYGTTGPRWPVRSQIITAWPGELTAIPSSLHASVVRVTVRGYPSGMTLRSIALRGSKLLPVEVGAGDLVRSERLARSQQDVLDGQVAVVLALKRLSKAVGADKGFRDAQSKMNAAVEAAKAGADADALENARAATEVAASEYRKVVTTFGIEAPANDAVASAQAVYLALNLAVSVPTKAASPPPAGTTKSNAGADPLPSGGDGIAKLKDLQTKLASLVGVIANKADELQAQNDTKAQGLVGTTQTLERLCRLSTELLPVVDEDIILDENRKGIYVLDYDFDAGFQRATPRTLMNTDKIYVRVRHVLPGGAVSLAFDGGSVIQHAVSLIGMPSSESPTVDSAGGATFSRPIVADDDPDKPLVQARSTQILALGQLEGGKRYDITICAQTGPSPGTCSNDVAATSSSGQKTGSNAGSSADQASTGTSIKPSAAGIISTNTAVARNTIIVHERRYLGVRAGLGATIAWGAVRSSSAALGTTQNYVHERSYTTDFSLPLLLTWYIGGRDSVEGPPCFSYGPVGGMDILKIGSTPRLYYGGTVDAYGFGLSLGGTAERIESVNLAEGTYLATGTQAPTKTEWHPGAFVALTTDLDVFERVFQSYFATAKFPTVGSK